MALITVMLGWLAMINDFWKWWMTNQWWINVRYACHCVISVMPLVMVMGFVRPTRWQRSFTHQGAKSGRVTTMYHGTSRRINLDDCGDRGRLGSQELVDRISEGWSHSDFFLRREPTKEFFRHSNAGVVPQNPGCALNSDGGTTVAVPIMLSSCVDTLFFSWRDTKVVGFQKWCTQKVRVALKVPFRIRQLNSYLLMMTSD